MSASVTSRKSTKSAKSVAAPVVEAPAAPVAQVVVVEEEPASEAEEMSEEHMSGEDDEDEDEDEDEEDEDEEGDNVSQVNIDLSDNEFYKGMCTLLEDENGNNIVQYIDLLCDETKEIADNTKHLADIKTDIHKMTKLFERWVMLEEAKARHAGISLTSHSSSSRSGGDDASVHTSKSSKSSSKRH